MRPDDVEPAEQLTGRAFAPCSRSGVTGRSPAQQRRWTDRLRHFQDVDPGGRWVADDGAVIGVAAPARRDLLWVLSVYAVDPGYQGRSVGAALLDAAIEYGRGCLRGFICRTPDPRAVRRYRRAGFTLYPTMLLSGVVDRTALPLVDGVRDGTDADLDLVDSVDRQLRSATHRPDHSMMRGYGPLLVCDLLTGSGYAYVDGNRIGLARRHQPADRPAAAVGGASADGTGC